MKNRYTNRMDAGKILSAHQATAPLTHDVLSPHISYERGEGLKMRQEFLQTLLKNHGIIATRATLELEQRDFRNISIETLDSTFPGDEVLAFIDGCAPVPLDWLGFPVRGYEFYDDYNEFESFGSVLAKVSQSAADRLAELASIDDIKRLVDFPESAGDELQDEETKYTFPGLLVRVLGHWCTVYATWNGSRFSFGVRIINLVSSHHNIDRILLRA